MRTFYIVHYNCDCASGVVARSTPPRLYATCPFCGKKLGPMQFDIMGRVRARSAFEAEKAARRWGK